MIDNPNFTTVTTSSYSKASGGMRASSYCDINGANCKTTSEMGGGADTNAITLCPNDQFLDGDGTCWTATQIRGSSYNDLPSGATAGFCNTIDNAIEPAYIIAPAVKISTGQGIFRKDACGCSAGFSLVKIFHANGTNQYVAVSDDYNMQLVNHLYTCVKN